MGVEKEPKRGPKDDKIEELENDLRKLQKCVTCVICQDMLFEPYSFQCGHVFCYTCTLDWLGLHKKRTCPECRAVVKNQPAPAYLIRDMIETFVLRAELNSPHGTGAELRKQQREALAAVNRDRATEGAPRGGLFHGMFKPGHKVLRAIRDPEDNVYRCPECNWEVEGGGVCEGCGRRVRSGSHYGDDFSDDDEEDDSGSETESQDDLPAWAEEEDMDEGWEQEEGLAGRIRRLDSRRFMADFSEDEEENDDGDEDDDEEDGMGIGPGRRSSPILVDDSDLSPQVAFTNRRAGVGPRALRPPPGVISQARESRGRRRRGAQESSEADEEEDEENSEDDEDEGSLEDFVVHDTPEARRNRPIRPANRNERNNRNAGVAIGANRNPQPYGPLVISSSPVIAAPTRQSRRTIVDTDDESSVVSEAFSRPPPFLGEMRHSYNHRRGPIALPSDNDEDTLASDNNDDEEDELDPSMGYAPLEHTASENEDEESSPPPRRGRRRVQSGRGGPSSVFSVPEEDEDDGDNDDSEDGDGDVRMTGGNAAGPRPRHRPQVLDDEDDGSDSDDDVVPVGRRRRGLPGASSYFRTHHHSGGGRRQREIVPNILDAFRQHRQAMSERQLDNLGFLNSARSATPVQRHFTGGSSRGGRNTREGTTESGWSSVQEATPMGQSSPPPPYSPMFEGVSSSPAPMQPGSPGLYPQSPANSNAGARVRGASESSNPWSPLASPQRLSQPPHSPSQQLLQSQAQQQPQRLLPQQNRPVPITIGSSPQVTRIRPRNSRQQLRGTSSRAGLRVGSVTPTPTSPSVGSTAPRASSATPILATTRGRRGVALTAEDIRARGEAEVRRRQQEAAEAANRLGRRSRRDLAATGGGASIAPVGRTGSGLQGRRLGAVIGSTANGRTGAGAGGMGGGPMLVIGSEDP